MKTNKNLDKGLKAEKEEKDKLEAELKIKGEELNKLNTEIKQLKLRIQELEGLKTLVESKTLKEAEESFLKARGE
ncbi:MAG: hypothetical protein QXM60_06325 [Thermoplasmatales archaeon]